jgi:septal ring-binding cell division protein DamX
MDSPERINSPEPAFDNEENAAAESRVEIALVENISNLAEVSDMAALAPQAVPIDILSGYSNTSFAIQLIALQTLEKVLQYTEEFNLNPPMYVKIRSQDSDWYVVLLGIYETRPEADAASEKWASSHNPSSRPWVRPIHPLRKAANLAGP